MKRVYREEILMTLEEFKALLIRSMKAGVSLDQYIRDQVLAPKDELEGKKGES